MRVPAIVCVMCTLALMGQAAPTNAPANAPTTSPNSAPATAPATQPSAAAGLPGITVDRAARCIDIEAVIVQRDAPWLELLACTKGSREHEAILSVTAKPSHIHLALIMLGLEPGAPMTTQIGRAHV